MSSSRELTARGIQAQATEAEQAAYEEHAPHPSDARSGDAGIKVVQPSRVSYAHLLLG